MEIQLSKDKGGRNTKKVKKPKKKDAPNSIAEKITASKKDKA